MFKLYLLSLAVSTVLIFVRCVYRVVEFSDDFNGVSWKSRVIGFGHAELDIGDADRAEYR
jgi:hypothetical protein